MWFFSSRKARRTPSARRRAATFRPYLEALEDRCVPSAPGSLDTTFGSGGIVTTSFGTRSNDYGIGVAVQSDGKIVEAGDSYGSKADYLDVTRDNPHAHLEISFDKCGK